MILGHYGLWEAFNTEKWKVFKSGVPQRVENLVIGSNSIDVTLDNKLLIPQVTKTGVDLGDQDSIKYRQEEFYGYRYIFPGEFLLGAVQESFDCSCSIGGEYFAPQFEGRSTIARLGLLVHFSAGFGDFGFQGAFTLEIANLGLNKIKLMAGMRIGQVFFVKVHRPKQYSGAYTMKEHRFGPVGPVIGPGRF